MKGVISDEQMNPHWEMNEDRHTSQHPGYRVVKCFECGRRNIQSVAVPAKTTCLGEHIKEVV